MPNFNPFLDDNEDTSFERGAPVTQAAKTVAKTAGVQTDDQIVKANQDIVNQLYGLSDPAGQDPQEQGTDEANPTHINHSNVASRAAARASGQSGKTSSNSNKTPEEEAEMEKVRRELFGNYSSKFQSAQNGAHGLITNLEQEVEKARKEREQKEMQRKQEDEEEEQRKKEEEEAKKQEEIATPAGKKTGVMAGRKQPIELERAKTKTEVNRGTTG